jgi:hypothetical protein
MMDFGNIGPLLSSGENLILPMGSLTSNHECIFSVSYIKSEIATRKE